MENPFSSRELDQPSCPRKAEQDIWNRLNTSHSFLQEGNSLTTIEEKIQGNLLPIEKLQDKSLMEFTTHYQKGLGRNFKVSRAPYEAALIDREMRPLTTRFKQSYKDIALVGLQQQSSKTSKPNSKPQTFKREVAGGAPEPDLTSQLVTNYLTRRFDNLNERTLLGNSYSQQDSHKNTHFSTSHATGNRHNNYTQQTGQRKYIEQVDSTQFQQELDSDFLNFIETQLQQSLEGDSVGKTRNLDHQQLLYGGNREQYLTLDKQLQQHFQKSPKERQTCTLKHSKTPPPLSATPRDYLPQLQYVTVLDPKIQILKAKNAPQFNYLKPAKQSQIRMSNLTTPKVRQHRKPYYSRARSQKQHQQRQKNEGTSPNLAKEQAGQIFQTNLCPSMISQMWDQPDRTRESIPRMNQEQVKSTRYRHENRQEATSGQLKTPSSNKTHRAKQKQGVSGAETGKCKPEAKTSQQACQLSTKNQRQKVNENLTDIIYKCKSLIYKQRRSKHRDNQNKDLGPVMLLGRGPR